MEILYYVDCACENHDEFRKFKDEEKARRHFESRECPSKILYKDTGEVGGLTTLKEVTEDNATPKTPNPQA